MVAQKQYISPKYAGFYNVGPEDSDCVTTGQLVQLFCRSWGGGLAWTSRPDCGPHEANFLKLDCSKIRRVFGWKPKWHVKEAVASTVDWAKAYMDGRDMNACMEAQIKEYLK